MDQKIKREIRKYFEINKNVNTTYSNFWNAAKAVLKGNLQLQKPTVKKKTLSQVNGLTVPNVTQRKRKRSTN